MDLLRAVIVGACGTPYQDGLFFFDFHLLPDYPQVPPVCFSCDCHASKSLSLTNIYIFFSLIFLRLRTCFIWFSVGILSLRRFAHKPQSIRGRKGMP